MGRSEIKMIVELVVGTGMAFLIVSNILGKYSWIVWGLAIVFVVYKISREGFNF
jgi:hypothetical protein